MISVPMFLFAIFLGFVGSIALKLLLEQKERNDKMIAARKRRERK